MTCDDAFDALTDPLRRHSATLKQHLDVCPRCRQMQLTLEPALHLFDADPAHQADSFFSADFDDDWPAADTPTPRELPSPESIRLAQQTAGKLAGGESGGRSFSRKRRLSVAGYAAALLVGMGLAWGASMSGWRRDDATSTWLHDDGMLELLHDDRVANPAPMLSTGCLRHEAAQFDRKDDDPHHNESARRAVVLACVACHLNGATTQ